MPFYAVAKGRNPGIYKTWPDCQTEIKSFNGAVFKKFSTIDEANLFISERGSNIIDKRETSSNFGLPSIINLVDNKISTSSSSPSSSPDRHSSVEEEEEDGKLSPPLERMRKKMRTLQKELSKLRENFDGYVEKQEKKSTKAKTKAEKKRNLSESTSEPEKKKKSSGLNDINDKSTSEPEKKKKSSGLNVINDKSKFTINSKGFLEVYTDGSCENNGQRNAKAGVGVYFGAEHPMNVAEPVVGRQTNNTAEIQAAIYALELSRQAGFNKVQINTDSQFMISCITSWMPSWKKKGWRKNDGKEIINLEDLKTLDKETQGMMIKWNHVKAHVGLEGNEAADLLAKEGASKH